MIGRMVLFSFGEGMVINKFIQIYAQCLLPMLLEIGLLEVALGDITKWNLTVLINRS